MELSELQERLEKADGPLDDETRAELWCAVQGYHYHRCRRVCGDDGGGELCVYYAMPGCGEQFTNIAWHEWPDASLDAAVGLVEQCGFDWAYPESGWVRVLSKPREHSLGAVDPTGKTIPLALCTALAKALSGQEKT